MNNRFEDAWSSAGEDGASCPVGSMSTHAGTDAAAELDLLMEAWFRERSGRIECSLVLEQARRLLSALVQDGGIARDFLRKATRLIHAIEKVQANDREYDHP